MRDPMKCQAKKQDGNPCRAWAVRGRTVCRVHGAGGNALEKTVEANVRHGRYSKYAPALGLAEYEQFLGDPNHLDLSDEIALARSVLAETMAGISGAPTEVVARIVPELLETVARVVEKENKRRATLNEHQAVVFLARVAEVLRIAVERHVEDVDTRRRIWDDVRYGLSGVAR